MGDYKIPSDLLALPNVKAVSHQTTSGECIEVSTDMLSRPFRLLANYPGW